MKITILFLLVLFWGGRALATEDEPAFMQAAFLEYGSVEGDWSAVVSFMPFHKPKIVHYCVNGRWATVDISLGGKYALVGKIPEVGRGNVDGLRYTSLSFALCASGEGADVDVNCQISDFGGAVRLVVWSLRGGIGRAGASAPVSYIYNVSPGDVRAHSAKEALSLIKNLVKHEEDNRKRNNEAMQHSDIKQPDGLSGLKDPFEEANK